MADQAVAAAHAFNAYLRPYVAWTPEAGESAWRDAQRFDRLSVEQKKPGHWYRFEGGSGLIEMRADGSGQWHKDGQLPPNVDPADVVTLPAGDPVPGLLDRMCGILGAIPETAPNHAQVAELIEVLKDLPSPERAYRLLLSFQKTLGTVPAETAEQIRFLHQASGQMFGTELLAGRVRGWDVAGVLTLTSLADALGATSPEVCSAVVSKAAKTEVRELLELSSRVIEDCWLRGKHDEVTKGLDALRSRAEGIIATAREGGYPEGHPELALDIYYGSLLQAVPFLIAANGGFTKLTHAPGVSEDDLEIFAHKAETAEEKLVRLTFALLYGARDLNLSLLREKQAEVDELLKTDRKGAEAFVRNVIDLELLYPTTFRSVLMGPDPVAADTAATA